MKNLSAMRWLSVACIVFASTDAAAQSKKALAGMLNEFDYGVPSSPAFELLPDKADESTHLVTTKDFQTAASIVGAGGFLKNSVAFDARPGMYSVGSLSEYQQNWLQRVLWRSVVGFGTTEAGEDRKDASVAIGVRLSLVDGSDPRADTAYLSLLEHSYASALARRGAPDPDMTEAQLKERSVNAALERADGVRDSLSKALWNAWKLDLGIGGMGRVKSAAADLDSLVSDRFGVWLAGAMPLGRTIQLNAVGKASWVRPDSAAAETHRWVLGSRLRWFASDGFTVSAEAAYVSSIHHGANGNDDAWFHVALFVELHLKWAGGWLGVGYGGDTQRKDGAGNGLQLKYAVYRDRILQR